MCCLVVCPDLADNTILIGTILCMEYSFFPLEVVVTTFVGSSGLFLSSSAALAFVFAVLALNAWEHLRNVCGTNQKLSTVFATAQRNVADS